MADLTLITARMCASCTQWGEKVAGSKPGTFYEVGYGPEYDGPYQYNWACGCPGFMFRNTCKHIKAAKEKICHWGIDALSGSPQEPNEDGTCPGCGGPTIPVKVGV